MEQSIQMELEQLEQQVGALDKKVGSMDKKMDNVLYLLAGSEYDDSNGLVAKIQSHESRIKALEDNVFNNALVSKSQAHEARLAKVEKLLTRAQWTLVGMSIPASIGIFEMLRKIVLK